MKKLKKKTVVLAAMLIMLSGAVYVNWQLSDSSLSLGDLITGKTKNLGEAVLVDNASVADTPPDDGKFTAMRVERQRARDESIGVLKTVTDSAQLSENEKKTAAETLAKLAKDIECEAAVENIVKAKGFSDCLAYIGEDSVTITVRTSEPLTRSQTGQIYDIVKGETGLSTDKIKIFEVE